MDSGREFSMERTRGLGGMPNTWVPSGDGSGVYAGSPASFTRPEWREEGGVGGSSDRGLKDPLFLGWPSTHDGGVVDEFSNPATRVGEQQRVDRWSTAAPVTDDIGIGVEASNSSTASSQSSVLDNYTASIFSVRYGRYGRRLKRLPRQCRHFVTKQVKETIPTYIRAFMALCVRMADMCFDSVLDWMMSLQKDEIRGNIVGIQRRTNSAARQCCRTWVTVLLSLIVILIFVGVVRGETVPLTSRYRSTAFEMTSIAFERVDEAVPLRLHVVVSVMTQGCRPRSEVFCSRSPALGVCDGNPFDAYRSFYANFVRGVSTQTPQYGGSRRTYNISSSSGTLEFLWDATAATEICLLGTWHISVQCDSDVSTFVYTTVSAPAGHEAAVDLQRCPSLSLEVERNWCDDTLVRVGVRRPAIPLRPPFNVSVGVSEVLTLLKTAVVDDPFLSQLPAVVNVTERCNSTALPNCTDVITSQSIDDLLSSLVAPAIETVLTARGAQFATVYDRNYRAGWVAKAAVPIGDPRDLGDVSPFGENDPVLAARYLLYLVWRTSSGDISANSGSMHNVGSDPLSWPSCSIEDEHWSEFVQHVQPGGDFLPVLFSATDTGSPQESVFRYNVPVGRSTQWAFVFLPMDTRCPIQVKTLDPRIVPCELPAPYRVTTSGTFLSSPYNVLSILYVFVLGY